MIITFCGHSSFRSTKEYEDEMLSLLENTVGENFAKLYLGGYGAFDEFAYKVGKKYQENHPKVKLILIIPYINNRKNDLSCENQYDEIIYPGLENVPYRFAIPRRNKWMIDQADLVIAYVDHPWGGAYQTYLYAERSKKKIFNLISKSL